MDIAIISLLLFLAVGGLSGGIPMLLKPDGSMLKISTDLLKDSPVKDYFWPGVFLLVVMTAWPLINVFAIWQDLSWAKFSTIVLGFVAMGWIIYQIFTIKKFWFLQPVIFIVGLLLVALSFVSL